MTDLEEFLLDKFALTWRLLKETDTEIEARQQAVTALLTAHPDLKQSLDVYLADARQSPVLHEKMSKKYASILETWLQRFPDELPQEVQEQFDTLGSL